MQGAATADPQVTLATKPHDCGTTADVRIVFSKASSDALTAHNLPACIMTTTLGVSPLASLFHALHDVYLPLLSPQQIAAFPGAAAPGTAPGNAGPNAPAAGLCTQLNDLLQQLDAGLGAAVRKRNLARVGSGKSDALGRVPDGAGAAAATAADEVLYWNESRATNEDDSNAHGHYNGSGARRAATANELRDAGSFESPKSATNGSDPAMNGSDRETSDVVAAVRLVMARFGASLGALEARGVSMHVALDEAESLYDALHELWELRVGRDWAYGQPRMRTFLALLGQAIIAVVQVRVCSVVYNGTKLQDISCNL